MIAGNSGASLELVPPYIYKWDCNNPIRLSRQMDKQLEWKSFISANPMLESIFEVPLVVNNNGRFRMPYYCGKNIIKYFQNSSTGEIVGLYRNIWRLINEESNHCIITPCIETVLTGKLESLKYPDISKLLASTSLTSNIPYGIYHGDITLSNVIVCNKIVLIDFLDTYYETPLQDIAKLLQEFRLKWTLLKSNCDCDVTKINIVYRYLEDLLQSDIAKYCTRFKVDAKLIWVFYLITLLRLLPYTKEANIVSIISKEIVDVESNLFDGGAILAV